MNLSPSQLTHFALLDAQIRNVDLEMHGIQARVVALAAERAEVTAERVSLYKSIGLDVAKHEVITSKKTHDRKTGAPLPYGQIRDLTTGLEYVDPPAELVVPSVT